MNFHATTDLDGIHARLHRGVGEVELAFLPGASALRHTRFREILWLVVASLGSNSVPKDANSLNRGRLLEQNGVQQKGMLD